MIKIVTNNEGSGDWIVILKDERELFAGHNINIFELEDLLKELGHEVEQVSISDEEMEEGAY